MAVDVWRRNDIRNALTAAQIAHESFISSEGDPIVQAYNAGYYKALRVIGANFGVHVDAPSADDQRLRQLFAPPVARNGSQS